MLRKIIIAILALGIVAGAYYASKQFQGQRRGFAPRSQASVTSVIVQEIENGNRGFTLIELMVVVIILGILALYIGPKIMGEPEKAKRVKAKMDIASLETALKMYKLDNGVYPSTEQGLQALVEAPESGVIPKKWRKGGYIEKNKAVSYTHLTLPTIA